MSESAATSFAEPVRVLSDLHLAHPASLIDRVSSLRPLLEGAATVIFNGDTCEQSCLAWREKGEEQCGELKALCAEVGARPIFLAGNHDPEISPAGWLDLAGGKVLVTHGHAIYPSVAPWSHEYLRKKKAVRKIVEERARAGADLAYQWETTRIVTETLKPDRARQLGRKGRKYLLSAAWPPERSFHILRVWITMVKAAQRFVERYRPEARVFLFGHFHRSGVWERGGRVLCNTGAFMRGARPLLAELDRGRLRVGAVEQQGGDYRWGETRSLVRVDGS